MGQCKNCGSYAINHNFHGRDGSDSDLCDVCYWRKRAEQHPAVDNSPVYKYLESWRNTVRLAHVALHEMPRPHTDWMEAARLVCESVVMADTSHDKKRYPLTDEEIEKALDSVNRCAMTPKGISHAEARAIKHAHGIGDVK